MKVHTIGRRSPYALLAAVVAALALALLALTPGGARADGPAPILVADPPPKTIVKVTGSAADGFGIHYFDGTADFPPTKSEALAECGEYDTSKERVHCRTKVRTWYYALADQQVTIRYYRTLLKAAS